jgi:hypothetical protein
VQEEIIDRLDRIVEALARPPREYVDIEGAADFLGVSRQTLDVWRMHREGPTFIRVGKQRIMYALADLRAFMSANRIEALS